MTIESAMPTPPRRFRFGLRTLFVLVVIVSIPCAWVGYSLNWIRQRHEFLKLVPGRHYSIPVSVALIYEKWHPEPLVKRPIRKAPALLWLFGEPAMFSIGVPPEMIERATHLFPEAEQIGPNEAYVRL